MNDIDQQLIAEANSKGKMYYGEVIEKSLREGAVMIKLLEFSPVTRHAIEVAVVDGKVAPLGRPFYLLKLKNPPADLRHDDIIKFQR